MTTEAKAVLVLGATGEAGSAVVRGLVATRGFRVLGAGRDPDKLSALAALADDLSVLRLDIRDRGALADALSQAGLVINCVGPYLGSGAQIARAAIDARVAYLDLASEQEHYRRLLQLNQASHAAGVPVLVGAGAYPGLSGIVLAALLRAHPDAEAAEMALIAGPHADAQAGRAQAISGLLELATPLEALEGGQLRRIVPGRRRVFGFPAPFGARPVMAWPQLEVLHLAATGQLRDLSTFVALKGHVPPPRVLLRALGSLRPTPGSAVLRACERVLALRRARARPATDPTTNHGAMVIALRAGATAHTATALATDLAAATAWLPVYIAQRWAAGELDACGVRLPMEVLSPEPVLAALRRADGPFALSGDGLGSDDE